MSIRFVPLLTVSVDHAYYSGGCRDLEFSISPATGEVLRGHRTIARCREGRLHLLYEAGDSGSPISSLAGRTLHLGVHANNPYFGNFTTPVLADAALRPLYANTAVPGALDPPLGVQLVAGLYAHAPHDGARPVGVSLSDAHGNVLDVRTLAAGVESASYDFRALPAGRYRIDEDYGGGNLRTRELLVDHDLRDAGVWGLLSLTIDENFYHAAPSFKISLDARAETLKYYIVADSYGQTEFDQLSVADLGHIDEERDEITFTKVLPAGFNASDIDPALLGNNSARIVSFQSDDPVARRERGPKRIHLNRNGSVLIEHLPLPGPDRTQAQFIVHLSKP